MFNNIFCEMDIKKVIHLSWGPGGNGGTVLIFSWKCNFAIYLDIQAITLLCLLLVLCVLFPSIESFFYLITALLKSDIVWHSKDYSSYSFQPTGIKLGSLWRGNFTISKYSVKFIIDFFQKKIFGHTYIFTKCIDNFKFTISLKFYEE